MIISRVSIAWLMAAGPVMGLSVSGGALCVQMRHRAPSSCEERTESHHQLMQVSVSPPYTPYPYLIHCHPLEEAPIPHHRMHYSPLDEASIPHYLIHCPPLEKASIPPYLMHFPPLREGSIPNCLIHCPTLRKASHQGF